MKMEFIEQQQWSYRIARINDKPDKFSKGIESPWVQTPYNPRHPSLQLWRVQRETACKVDFCHGPFSQNGGNGSCFFQWSLLDRFCFTVSREVFCRGINNAHIYVNICVPSRLLDNFIIHIWALSWPSANPTAAYWPRTTKQLPVQPQNRPSTPRVIQYCPTNPLTSSTKHHIPMLTHYHQFSSSNSLYSWTVYLV